MQCNYTDNNIIITDIILLTNWWAWLDYRAGGERGGLPPLPAVVDIILIVVVVLVVGLAHVVVVRSVGVAVVRRVEAVSEVVEMVRVGIHQSLQRPRVHWRHYLNITVQWQWLQNRNILLPCAGRRAWSRCVSWGYCCDRKSSHTCHTLYFWSSGELCECVDLD